MTAVKITKPAKDGRKSDDGYGRSQNPGVDGGGRVIHDGLEIGDWGAGEAGLIYLRDFIAKACDTYIIAEVSRSESQVRISAIVSDGSRNESTIVGGGSRDKFKSVGGKSRIRSKA